MVKINIQIPQISSELLFSLKHVLVFLRLGKKSRVGCTFERPKTTFGNIDILGYYSIAIFPC